MITKITISLFVSPSTGMHSLKYFYTAVSGDIDFPEFTAVGLVDEVQFIYFDSNTMKAVPKTEWIRRSEGADYWDSETQIGKHKHQNFQISIKTAIERFNQSKGKLITKPTDKDNMIKYRFGFIFSDSQKHVNG